LNFPLLIRRKPLQVPETTFSVILNTPLSHVSEDRKEIAVKCFSPQNSYFENLTSNVGIFGDASSKQVINVKSGFKKK
jgi:hypothetical protein